MSHAVAFLAGVIVGAAAGAFVTFFTVLGG